MALKQPALLLIGKSQSAFPIVNPPKQRVRFHQIVVLAGQVRTGAAPGIIFCVFNDTRRDRVHLDVTSRGNEMRFVHDKGSEAFLPEVATPAFTKIDAAGVATVSFADGASQALFGFGDCNQVNMLWFGIRHQAQIS
ncbi:MAG TPA: hypothetical protein VGA63_08725, partial [Geopsychrobacteraceae bacterium]